MEAWRRCIGHRMQIFFGSYVSFVYQVLGIFCQVKKCLNSSAGVNNVKAREGTVYRGYYTVARRYEFCFRMAKQYCTNERSE